ncbi:MAG: helix-turn-helix transcriptional regulator [Lachnospiraceae bacterium]
MFNEYEELLTIDELCEILCIGRNTSYRLLKNNELRANWTGVENTTISY